MRGLARLLGVQSGEGAPVAWLIVHSLFNGIFSAFFLTAANALFLARFPISVLPLAYIAAALVGYLSVTIFSRLERLVSFGTLLMLNLGTLFAIAAGLWFLRRYTDADWVVFAMFVLVGPMFNLIALGYWGLAGRLFDLRQAKRLFGLVGAGEELSTVIALFSTPFLLKIIAGPDNLVPLAAAGLAGSLMTVALIACWRFRGNLESGSAKSREQSKARVGLADLLRVRYFLLMAASVILLNLALYTIDFSFLAQVRIQFQDPAQIARFFAIFFGALKIVELLLKVGVSGPLLSQFGLNVGLLVLPVVLSISAIFAILIGSFGLGAANFFVLVALSKLVAVTGRSSTFEPSFRVLYQPVASSERTAYQSHVEGTARQVAIGVVGVALLLFSRGGAFNALVLFYLLVPILGLWIVTAVLAHREYRVRLFEGLKQHTVSSEVHGPLDILMPFLRSTLVSRRRRALSVIERIEPGALPVALTSALEGQGSTHLAALECVGSARLIDFEPQVAQIRDAREANADVTAAVTWASTQLSEVRALTSDRSRLESLAG
jgi:AAA family ATP:ADP antiporter